MNILGIFENNLLSKLFKYNLLNILDLKKYIMIIKKVAEILQLLKNVITKNN